MNNIIRFIMTAVIISIAFAAVISADEITLPESFDLRDVDGKSYVTNVKSQGVYGTCWAFSICSAMESNYIMDGNQETDLSELALAYHVFNAADDSLGNIPGDGAYIIEDSGSNFAMAGYNDGGAAYSLLTWIGPLYEADAPYSDIDTVIEASDNESGLLDSLAYNSAMHLQNTRYFPFDEPESVKAALMKYGLLVINFKDASRVMGGYYDNQLVYRDYPLYYNESTFAYYKYQFESSSNGVYGHSITLVGWDDNFPAANFITSPPDNGAWLCKDNAGEDYADNGYFWISYYDYDFNIDSGRCAIAFDVEPGDNYDRNYQYDGGSLIGYITLPKTVQDYDPTPSILLSNVFHSASDETLEAVGFSMMQLENTEYDIKVFINPETVYNSVSDTYDYIPDGGTLASHQTGKTDRRGYYTISLDTPVSLKAGDTFAIVIQYEGIYDTKYGYEKYYDIIFDIDYSRAPWVDIAFNTSSERGQSYIATTIDNIWYDLGDYSPQNNMWPNANLRIKGYTSLDSVSISDAVSMKLNGVNNKAILDMLKRVLENKWTTTIKQTLLYY